MVTRMLLVRLPGISWLRHDVDIANKMMASQNIVTLVCITGCIVTGCHYKCHFLGILATVTWFPTT